MTDELLKKLPSLLLSSAPDKPFTLPCVFGKEYGENFISDWLCFCLDPMANGIGYEPLNMLLKLAGKEINPDEEYADFEHAREVVLNKDSRIDILIPVYRAESDLSEESAKPKYYIAVENKIHADEGEDQTKRYYDYIQKLDKEKKEKNIYIFLHNKENQKPKCTEFKSVLYKDLISEFKQIPLPFVSDIRRAFLFQEFIIHIREYLIENSFQLTQSNCDLLCEAEDIINEYKQNKETEIIQKAYAECIKIKNVFFDMLYKKICEKYSQQPQFIIKKSRQGLYIQIFKEEWEKYNIHYELIINSHKSIPYPDCEFLLMIHCENSEKNDNASRKRRDLKEKLSLKSETEKFNKPHFCVYEQLIDTEDAFSSPEKVSDFIEDVADQLDELINNTVENIDSFVSDEN